MGNDKHYNATIDGQLTRLVQFRAWDELTAYLSRLSNSEFRTAGYVLGERVMPPLPPDDFWALFGLLARFRPKAFLVTMLKTAAERVGEGTLTLQSASLDTLFGQWNEDSQTVDKQKFVQYMLPTLATPAEVRALFRRLHVDGVLARMDFLLRCDTLPAQYTLFTLLKEVEHDAPLLRRCCIFLMKKGDSRSYNLASIIRNYFDVPDVPGTFSLRLQPHELSYLDKSFDTFCKVMRSV